MSRRNWHRWIVRVMPGRLAHRANKIVRRTPDLFAPRIETLESRTLLSALTVATTAASPISATGATLNGSVDPNGSTAIGYFQYSTDAAFTPTVENTIGSGFLGPNGVAFDAAGDVFVADTLNDAVKELLPDGTIQTIGSAFSKPMGVAVDAAGDVFVVGGSSVVNEVLADGTTQTIGSGLSGPMGVAVDAAGDVFVADTHNNAVKEVLPDGTIQTVGSGFINPSGVAVDASGDVFVADTGHNAVKAVLGDGTIQTIGSGFMGPTGVAVDATGDVFVADKGTETVKEVLPNGTIETLGTGFRSPVGVAVDAAGDVSVADSSNTQAFKLSPTAVAATPSSLSGSTATAVSAALVDLTPGTTYYYRAVASSATSLVADTTSPPQSFTTLTPPGVATTAASSISAGGATLGGMVNPEGKTATAYFQYSTDSTFTPTVESTVGSGFSYPTGVAVDTVGDVFVADAFSSVLKEVLPDGTIKAIGSGFLNPTFFPLPDPSGLAVDAAGDVFVANAVNNAVKEVLPNGTIQTIGSGFSQPESVAVDASGDVFVADFGNEAVKEVQPDGTITTIGSGFSGPTSVAVDASGDVFVADQRLSLQGYVGVVSEVLPDGTTKTIGTGFGSPASVAVDTAGDVFVADGSNGVKEILPDGSIKTIGSGFLKPNGVAVDASGDVFVSDGLNGRVVELSPPTVAATPSPLTGSTATAVSGTLAGLTPGTTYFYRVAASSAGGAVADATSPPASFTTLLPTAGTSPAGPVSATGATLNGTLNAKDAAATGYFQYSTSPTFTPSVETTLASGFIDPNGVAANASGDVFVTDGGEVKEVLPDGAIKTIVSGFNNPLYVAVDASGDVFVAGLNSAVTEVMPNGSTKTIDLVSAPSGVAADASGDLFVSEGSNVKEIQPDGTTKAIGSGFDDPTGLAVDASGDVFVYDIGNGKVKEVLPDGSIQTIGSGLTQPNGFQTIGVAVDAIGDVFVSDPGNKRIVKLSPPAVAAMPSPVSSSTATAVSGTLLGLTPGTTYYYRLEAASAGGALPDIPSESFTTLTPPAVATGPATSTSTTGATLGGTVNPDGSTTAAYFQYSTDSAFTPSVETSVGSGFSQPNGVAVDASGDVFVADKAHDAIQEILTNGTINTIGSGLSSPSGVAVDAAGDVFVADQLHGTVKELLPNGNIMAIGSGFSLPTSVAVNATGDVFVADDHTSAIEEVLPDGTVQTLGSGLLKPSGVAVDAAGDVFVADTGNHQVKEILPGGGIQTLGSGFSAPAGVAVDASGDVFVADYGKHDVVEILSDGTIQTLGSAFGTPAGVAVDGAGDVFVADTGNHLVVELSPPTLAATPSALNGSTAATVSANLIGLLPGTTYYDRAVAVSAGGTVAGLTGLPESFTTPTINWPKPADITYGTALGAAQLDTTATSGGLPLSGSFTYTLGDGTTPAAGAVLSAGQNQVLNVTFTPTDTTDYATDTAQIAINVDQAPLAVTASGTQVYGGSPTFAAAYSGFVLGQNSSVLGGTLAFATTTSSSSDVGRHPSAVTANGLTSSNYAISFVPGNMVVTPAPLTVTGSGTQSFGGSPTFAAAYSGFVLGQNSSALGGTLAFATTTTSGSPVGTYPNAVTASGLTSTNYAISFAAGDMVVTQATPSITWANPSDITYGSALGPTQLDATANVAGTFSYTLADGTTPAIGVVLHAGQNQLLNVTFTPTDSTDYTSASAHVEINVDPARLTITADDKSKVYGAPLPTLTASFAGFVNRDNSASLSTPPSLSTTATAGSHVTGSPYSITASGAVDADYIISYVPGTLTVTPAPLTITADDKSKVYGGPLPTLTASYTGFVNGDGAASLAMQPSLATTATTGSHVSSGPYAITASGASDADYTISYVPGALTVTPAPLTITADDMNKVYGAALPTLTASYSGFVNGDSSASLTTPPTLSTTATASSHVAGSPYTITASSAADADYTISYVPGTLTVTPAPLTITADDKSKVYGGPLPTLTASYTGFVNGDGAASLAVQPSLATAAATGSHVSSGPYAITASGASDADYTISYVPGTLTVTPAPLTITADDKSKVYGAALPPLTASYSGFVNGDSSASLTTPPTLSTTATASSHVADSPYSITASGASDADYTISYVPGELAVTPAPLTVTADNKTKAFGSANPPLTDTISGFVNGDTASVVTGQASLSTTATAASGIGSYPIVAALGTLSAADYTFTFHNGTLTIAPNLQGAFGLAEDIYVIGSGTVSVSSANGVLSNDSGTGQLTVTSGTVAGAEGGTFVFHADGSFTYTPPNNFPGFDYAKYTATDAGASQATATVNVLSQAGGVIWKFYEQVLHRDPDYAGLQGWIKDFLQGGTPGDIAAGFFESTELLNQIISGYYYQYLGRAPDANGMLAWEGLWRQTGGPEVIKAGFASSAEFNSLAGNSTGTNSAGWIEALYQRILNRTPKPGEVTGWQQQLAAGTSEYQVALDFFTSLEAFDNDVTGWFYEYFDRAPTTGSGGEQPLYANQMIAGASDRQIEQELTNLPAYVADPPASPAGTGVRLPNYLPATSSAKTQASIAATDAVFGGFA